MGGDERIPVTLHSREVEPVPVSGAALVVVGAIEPPVGWAAVATVPEAALATAHPGSCRCCGGRNGFSQRLGELFRNRATGILPFFHGIVVWLPRELVMAAAGTLERDLVTSARFRLETPAKRKLISD